MSRRIAKLKTNECKPTKKARFADLFKNIGKKKGKLTKSQKESLETLSRSLEGIHSSRGKIDFNYDVIKSKSPEFALGRIEGVKVRLTKAYPKEEIGIELPKTLEDLEKLRDNNIHTIDSSAEFALTRWKCALMAEEELIKDKRGLGILKK